VINHGGGNPTRDEDANDCEAKIRKVVVQTADYAPKPTFEAKLAADQPEDFDAHNEESNSDRRRRDCLVVPKLADRVDQSLAVGPGPIFDERVTAKTLRQGAIGLVDSHRRRRSDVAV
jgi:hypothetical protein